MIHRVCWFVFHWLPGALLASVAVQAPDDRPADMLWVWERPTDLRWLPPQRAGVAYLRTQVLLKGDTAQVTRRRQPIHMPAAIYKMPVVHVDIDNLQPPTLNDQQLQTLVATVQAAAAHGAGWVQLDFEARHSQRAFYLQLLSRLQPMRRHTRLSVTALASWCMQDTWLDAKLVDEVVPMLFRMHRDGPAIREHLKRYRRLPVEACNQAVGLLVGQPVPPPDTAHRLYWFHQGDWQATTRFDKENPQ